MVFIVQSSSVLLAQKVDIVGLHNTCPPGWLSCRWLFDRYILFPVRGGLQRQLYRTVGRDSNGHIVVAFQ